MTGCAGVGVQLNDQRHDHDQVQPSAPGLRWCRWPRPAHDHPPIKVLPVPPAGTGLKERGIALVNGFCNRLIVSVDPSVTVHF